MSKFSNLRFPIIISSLKYLCLMILMTACQARMESIKRKSDPPSNNPPVVTTAPAPENPNGESNPTDQIQAKSVLVLKNPKMMNKQEIFLPQNDFLKIYNGFFDLPAFDYFLNISEQTRGFLTFSPAAQTITLSIESVIKKILKETKTENLKKVDISLVFDSSNSMAMDFFYFKKNKNEFLDQLSQQFKDFDFRLSIVLFRDQNCNYITKISQDFTSDLSEISSSISSMEAGEGNKDNAEAVADGLEVALKKLSWRKEAKRSVILIGDTAGRPKTLDPQQQEEKTIESVLQDYNKENPPVKIHSILCGQFKIE